LLPFDSDAATTGAAAPHAAGGFYHQLPYATLAALDLDKGETLGVELLDDVSRSGPAGTDLIQIKKETTPVTDMNRGLWKALANWSKLIRFVPRDDIRTFAFVTTAPIHGAFPHLLLMDTSAEERARYVLENIRPSTDAELSGWIKQVTSLSGPLASLLGRVKLIRGDGAATLYEKIRDGLRYQFRDDVIDRAALEFEGWVTRIVVSATQKNEGALISENEVRGVLLNMQSWIRPQQQNYRHGRSAIDPRERDEQLQSTFIKQLKAIDAPAELSLMALEDYLRQVKEEIDWATNLEVGRKQVLDYRDQIRAKWDLLSMDTPGHWKDLENADRGRRLCDEMLKSPSPRLFVDDVPPAHVYRGSCHILADRPRIGWHREWKTLFNYDDSEGEE
jgi:hypothetical protein